MGLFKAVSRITVILAAVASASLAIPAAQASDGDPSIGKTCGAYRTMEGDWASLQYYHCGSSYIIVEVDYREGDNGFVCVLPWQDKFLAYYIYASNAWYVRPTDYC
ncbi:DUF6355 family natural product biosynthesis protein [Nonomuraea sp. KM90]|uniref:DUF6355 family natural product biosynthesis protein n=1 Tax=Nonomuraea sp. KM90 TaxID=3457428 RepID=UPI003FCC7981